MGLFSGLMGNASEIDVAKLRDELGPLLAEGETLEKAYQLVRDMVLFTSRRIIFVSKQGLTGHKVEYRSVPYRSIAQYSIETAGHLELDAELKIWVRGMAEPIKQEFNRKVNIYEVQAVLTKHLG